MATAYFEKGDASSLARQTVAVEVEHHPSPPPTASLHDPLATRVAEMPSERSRTLRESLRAKIEKAKAERGTPSPDVQVQLQEYPRRRLGDVRSGIKTTRFDAQEEEEDASVAVGDSVTPSTLDKLTSTTTALKWKLFSEKARAASNEGRKVESYQFFVGSLGEDYEPFGMAGHQQDREGDAREEAGQGQGQREGEDDLNDTHSRDALIDELERVTEDHRESNEEFGIVSQAVQGTESSQVTFRGAPLYLENVYWSEREQDIYFIPSSSAVPLEHKISPDQPARSPESEGFYVPPRPRMNWKNYSVLENRLVQRREGGRHWFGEDGLVQISGTILQPELLRPDAVEYANVHQCREELQAYRSARIPSLGASLSDEDTSYQLDVSLGVVQFHHHPLFSEEHVIASELRQTYHQYTTKLEQDRPRMLREKLNALRHSVQTLQEALEGEVQKGDSVHVRGIEKQLHQAKKDIKAALQEKIEEEALQYNMFYKISSLWQSLKRQRQTQGFTTTYPRVAFRHWYQRTVCRAYMLSQLRSPHFVPIKVFFSHMHCEDNGSTSSREAEWRADLEDEVWVLREEFSSELAGKQEVYQQELTAWKERERRRKKTLRRHRALLQASAQDPQAEVVELPLVPEETPKPSPPGVFNEVEARQHIWAHYQQTRRPLDEPLFQPEMLTAVVSPLELCPNEEQQRRVNVSSLKYYVKVLINGREVAKSAEKSLDQCDFVMKIREVFHAKVWQWPESVTLQLYQVVGLGAHLISEVYLPVPEGQGPAEGGALASYQFSDSREVVFGNNAVGSGVPRHDGRILLTSGHITASVRWSPDDSGCISCPPAPRDGLRRSNQPSFFPRYLSATGHANLRALKKWIDDSHTDPNDPRNAELMQLVNSLPTDGDLPDYFRLSSLDNSARFVSDNAFNTNKRFQLLELRRKKHPGVRNKVIPAKDGDVTDRMWKSAIAFDITDPYELPCELFGAFRREQRREQDKYLNEVRESVLSRVREATQEVTLSDVVYFELIPNVVTLKNAVVDFFSPRRPLQPKRRVKREAKAVGSQISEAKISIRVVKAVNVPRRIGDQTAYRFDGRREGAWDTDPLQGADSTWGEPSNLPDTIITNQTSFQADLPAPEVPVRPFVEVSFEGVVERTATTTGVNPYWNEELVLPLTPPDNDFSPSNLSKISSFLHFNLFDEVVVDVLKDERQRATNVHHRVERKWLGSYAVPFSTLHLNPRFEGNLTVDVPPFILGYSQKRQQDNVLAFDLEEAESVSPTPKTSLHVFVSVDPHLPQLPPVKHKFDSTEPRDLLLQADVWLQKLLNKFPKRMFQATALDVSGKHVFLTRYIKAQNPPDELLGEGDVASLPLMERLARYVSLIPYLPDTRAFAGVCDIWASSEQFLKMLAGDEEEHAILLCNYFKFIRMPAWVVLGEGIPEGPTAYVLTGMPSGVGYLLWNPNTGRYYRQYDPHCPLKSVGCIFNQDNIWANIQPYDDPGRISFSVDSSKQWCPLFKDTAALASHQADFLNYKQTDLQGVVSIEEQLDSLLFSSIQTWRTEKALITRWNRHCCAVLRAVLERCERDFSTILPVEDVDDLNNLTAAYKMNGFPIHMCYGSAAEVLDKVRSTGIHLLEDEKAELARAVYVHPYPHDVLSVWVYVATLVRL